MGEIAGLGGGAIAAGVVWSETLSCVEERGGGNRASTEAGETGRAETEPLVAQRSGEATERLSEDCFAVPVLVSYGGPSHCKLIVIFGP